MTKPTITLQALRTRIGQRAKSAPEHRFWGLHVHVVKLETLEAAYLEARRNGGAPGSDGVTFEQIEAAGRHEFLTELAADLRAGTYRPGPYRRREIPKEGGKVRVISIPIPQAHYPHVQESALGIGGCDVADSPAGWAVCASRRTQAPGREAICSGAAPRWQSGGSTA